MTLNWGPWLSKIEEPHPVSAKHLGVAFSLKLVPQASEAIEAARSIRSGNRFRKPENRASGFGL
jgi:hypothetical protein